MPTPSAGPGPRRSSDTQLVALLALCAAGFYAAPWPVVYLPCFLALAVLTFRRLPLALALVPAFAPFVMEPKYIGHLTFAPTEILIWLDVAIAVLLLALRTESMPQWRTLTASPFLFPAAVLVCAVALSTLFAPDRHLALHAFRERVVDPLVFFSLVLLFVRTRSDWYWILGGAVAGGAAAGAIALGQFVLQRDLSSVNGTGIKRVQALYGSPDNLGLLFDRIVPFWFVLVLLGGARGALKIAAWAGGILLLVVPLALTYSLGAWIAVGLACAVVAAAYTPWGRWAVLAIAVVGVAGIGMKHQSVTRAFQSGHSSSTQTRLDVWRSSLRMIRDRPIVGIGPDNFQRLYAPTAAQDKYQHLCPPGLGYMQPGAGSEPCLSHPHDEMLDFWLSGGIAGLAAYLWLLFVFWREAWRLQRSAGEYGDRIIVLAVMAGMLAGLIHGLIDNSYFLVDLSLVFWLFCALVSWLSTGAFAARETENATLGAPAAGRAGAAG